MNLIDIKKEVDAGNLVYWKNENYQVVKDQMDRYLILSLDNKYCIGLTWMDNKTLNGIESDFFTKNK